MSRTPSLLGRAPWIFVGLLAIACDPGVDSVLEVDRGVTDATLRDASEPPLMRDAGPTADADPLGPRLNSIFPNRGPVEGGTRVVHDRHEEGLFPQAAWEATLRGMSEAAVIADYVAQTPLGRLEEPEDVAKTVLFLASDLSGFITGEAINVTGGVRMD